MHTAHRHVLTSLEATRIEPGLYDKKVYARGIGIVLERTVTGPTEIAKLVSMKGSSADTSAHIMENVGIWRLRAETHPRV